MSDPEDGFLADPVPSFQAPITPFHISAYNLDDVESGWYGRWAGRDSTVRRLAEGTGDTAPWTGTMDLRTPLDAPGFPELASQFLDYQPFLLSDDLQTGAAHSWTHAPDPRVAPRMVFRRSECSEALWEEVTDAGQRCRAMYDDILDDIAGRFPGGTLLDVACNNGYFPVGAELRGMQGTGIDLGDYSHSVNLLNRLLGTNARFLLRSYDSVTHRLDLDETFDVTIVMAILCHLPDPLHFLAEVARVTTKAVIFWGRLIETDALLVSYQPPHPNLSSLKGFPHSFNDNTQLSTGLFRESMRLCGFRAVIEIPARPTWPTTLCPDAPSSLDEQIHGGTRHLAMMALR